MRLLRRVPAPLLVAQLVGVAVAVFRIVSVMTTWFASGADRSDSPSDTLIWGSTIACQVLALVGLWTLGRRFAGNQRRAIRVAFLGVAMALLIHLGWLATLLYRVATGSVFVAYHAFNLAGTAAAVAAMVGLGLATRRWYWGAIGCVVAVVTNPPWFLDPTIGWYDGDVKPIIALAAGRELLAVITILALAALACRDVEPIDEPAPPAAGLRRARRALYGLAISAVVTGCGVVVRELVAVPEPPVRFAIMLASALELTSLIALALAMLAAVRGRSELPRGLSIAGATIALSVAGTHLYYFVMLVQQCLVDFVPPTSGSRIALVGPSEPAFVPALASQLLASCAVGVLLVAIAIAARRRGLDALRGRAMALAGAFAALAVGALTTVRLVSHVHVLTPSSAARVLAGAAGIAASWLVAAVVVRKAEDELGIRADLPAAQLVRVGSQAAKRGDFHVPA